MFTEKEKDCFHINQEGDCIIEEVSVIKYAQFIWNEKIKRIIFPAQLTRIEDSAFCNCTQLEKVILPEGLTYLGRYAFGNCTSLTHIVLPSNLTEIKYAAFGDCTSLTEIILPEGVNKIETNAFGRCTGLTTITLPISLTTLEDRAFSGCTNLRFIVIDSKKENEFHRIRAMLPEYLQSLVISKQDYLKPIIKELIFGIHCKSSPQKDFSSQSALYTFFSAEAQFKGGIGDSNILFKDVMEYM